MNIANKYIAALIALAFALSDSMKEAIAQPGSYGNIYVQVFDEKGEKVIFEYESDPWKIYVDDDELGTDKKGWSQRLAALGYSKETESVKRDIAAFTRPVRKILVTYNTDSMVILLASIDSIHFTYTVGIDPVPFIQGTYKVDCSNPVYIGDPSHTKGKSIGYNWDVTPKQWINTKE